RPTSRRPKKQSRAQRPDIPPHPLVDPGNPPHSPTSRAKTNSTCRHHRMVALAAGSSSRSTEISYQTKITAVMLVSVRRVLESCESVVIQERCAEKDAMGRAARTMAPSSLQRINGAPHATAERFEQIPRNSRTRCNTNRRDRDGPVELAGRRYRAWRRALAVEEARGR